jgi:hypothetical protein
LQHLGASSPVLQRLTIHTLQPIVVACGCYLMSYTSTYPELWIIMLPLVVYVAYSYRQYGLEREVERSRESIKPLTGDVPQTIVEATQEIALAQQVQLSENAIIVSMSDCESRNEDIPEMDNDDEFSPHFDEEDSRGCLSHDDNNDRSSGMHHLGESHSEEGSRHPRSKSDKAYSEISSQSHSDYSPRNLSDSDSRISDSTRSYQNSREDAHSSHSSCARESSSSYDQYLLSSSLASSSRQWQWDSSNIEGDASRGHHDIASCSGFDVTQVDLEGEASHIVLDEDAV